MTEHGPGKKESAKTDVNIPGDIEAEPNADQVALRRGVRPGVADRELDQHHGREEGARREIRDGTERRRH